MIERSEIACYTPRIGMAAVRLFGGPWDGKEVGVVNPQAARIKVFGPRHGDHHIWIEHFYVLRNGRHEFEGTEVFDFESVGT